MISVKQAAEKAAEYFRDFYHDQFLSRNVDVVNFNNLRTSD